MLSVPLASTFGFGDTSSARRFAAGSRETPLFHKSLNQDPTVSIACYPVVSKLPGAQETTVCGRVLGL